MLNSDTSRLPMLSGQKVEFCSACASRPASIFCDLPPASLVEMDQLRQPCIYPPRTTVYREGDQPQALYCVNAGFVKLSRNSPDGRAVALGIAKAGDVLGARPLLLGKPHDLTAEAVAETRICFISQNDFLNFLERNADVSLRLAQKLSIELGEAYRQVYSAVLRPAAERLADVLLTLCQTHGQPVSEGVWLNTNMCQNELAELAGMSRRNLNRALKTLRDKGLIECRRRSIIVRNLVALQNCQVS